MAAFQIGDVILGKYEVTRVLGQGGMGIVFAARHRELDAPVALKFLLPSLRESPQSGERFAAEARTAMRLKNEHVVRVYDVAAVNGAPFIVMEYLTGEDLSKVIAARGALPVAEAVDLLLQAGEAIADAHNLGIVHRDLKPANLFLTTGSDELPFVKVLDFGISKSAAHPSVTATAAVVGSPLYMSPEQLAASRRVGPRCDVWALGVILYEMLTGATPFARESVALISAAILHGAYPRLATRRADLPAAVDEAVDGALQVDPEARLPSVEALAARLAPFGTDAARASLERIRRIAARGLAAARASETAPPHGTRPGPAVVVAGFEGARPRRRRWWLAAIAAATLLSALTLVGWRVASRSRAASAGPAGSASAATGPSDPTDAATPREADADAGADRDGGARWRASRIEMDGLILTVFVHASWSSPAHPQGTVAALASEVAPGGREWRVSVACIDVGSGRAFARVPVGAVDFDAKAYLSAAPAGALVALQRDKALDLVSIDADGCVQSAPTISLAGLGRESRYDFRGMAMVGDRIVLASGGNGTTTLRILDEHGALLTRHDCHAGLVPPGEAKLARVGDDVVVTSLLAEFGAAQVCAGQLHGRPRWREVTLPGGRLFSRDGVVYFQGYDGAIVAAPRALDSNLQPTAPDPQASVEVASDDYCSGLTGELLEHAEKIHDRIFMHMTSCCGGAPGGLFVCKPSSEIGP